MKLEVKDTHDFDRDVLQELFLSLDWSSGYYPDKLVVAIKNYAAVYSVWDGERLLGLAAAMDDGIMTAYVHYVLVRPDCQGLGVGRMLMDKIKDHYKDYLRIVLNSYNDKIPFYEKCGFKAEHGETPMFITEMWT